MTHDTTGSAPELEEIRSPSPTVAVSRPASAGRPDRRWRWAAALTVVALVVAASVVGAALLVGASAGSTVARWAPPDAVAYVEIRADLPGDQEAALGEFLSAFPGFADQAILDQKLSQLYDRLIAAATDGQATWSADIAPWFGGQLGLAMEPPPADLAERDWEHARSGLVVATSTDPVKAIDWVEKSLAEAGKTGVRSDDGAVHTLVVERDGQTLKAAAGPDVLLVGPATSVDAALARDGTDGLATTDRFREAIAALPGDAIAVTYLDLSAVISRLDDGAVEVFGRSAADLAGMIPAWAAGQLRVEGDALLSEGAAPHPSDRPSIPNARSRLPDRLPASTIALAEAHGIGAAIADGPAGDAAWLDELDTALAPVGGLDGLVGWVDEAGAVVLDGDEPSYGVVAIAADPDAAADLGRSLSNLASLGGLDPTETTHAGASITTIDLSGIPEMQPGGSRSDTPRSVSWTVAGDLVVVGLDVAFVTNILDAQADGAATLADDGRFRELVDRAGAEHRALAWADLDAIEALVVAELPADERTRFEREVRPYLEPFSDLVGVVRGDGDLDRTRGLVVLDE